MLMGKVERQPELNCGSRTSSSGNAESVLTWDFDGILRQSEPIFLRVIGGALEKGHQIGIRFHREDSQLFDGTFIIVPSPFQNLSRGTRT